MKKAINLPLLAVFLMLCQFCFWYGLKFNNEKTVIWEGTKSVKPEMEILPKVPSEEIIKATSFGDEEISFRYNSYILQFAGDTFGRVTPLKDYDYAKLYKWWSLLDNINSDSDLLAYMVAYYFSATQNPKEQMNFVIDFLEEHSDKHPEKKWWWYGQAAYNAKFKLKDKDRALEIATKLGNLPKELDIPMWARQMRAFIYEDSGEFNKACDIIVGVVQDFSENKLTEGELNFIYHFINERIEKMVIKEAEGGGKLNVSDECRAIMEYKKATDLKNFNANQAAATAN